MASKETSPVEQYENGEQQRHNHVLDLTNFKDLQSVFDNDSAEAEMIRLATTQPRTERAVRSLQKSVNFATRTRPRSRHVRRTPQVRATYADLEETDDTYRASLIKRASIDRNIYDTLLSGTLQTPSDVKDFGFHSLTRLGVLQAAINPEAWVEAVKDTDIQLSVEKLQDDYLKIFYTDNGKKLGWMSRGILSRRGGDVVAKVAQKRARSVQNVNFMATAANAQPGPDTTQAVFGEYVNTFSWAVTFDSAVNLLYEFDTFATNQRSMSKVEQELVADITALWSSEERQVNHTDRINSIAFRAVSIVQNRIAELPSGPQREHIKQRLAELDAVWKYTLGLHDVHSHIMQKVEGVEGAVIQSESIDITPVTELDKAEKALEEATQERDKTAQERDNQNTAVARAKRELELELEALRVLYDEQLQAITKVSLFDQDVRAPWEVTKQQIRRLELADMWQALVRGVQTPEGNVVYKGQSKDDAQKTIGTLSYLAELTSAYAGNTGQFNHYIGVLDACVHVSKNDIVQFEQAIEPLSGQQKRQLLALMPSLFDPKVEVDRISMQWNELGSVIEQYWPNGQRVRSDIEAMLFGDKPTPAPEEKQPNEVVDIVENMRSDGFDGHCLPDNTGDRELLRGQASQLEQIILPPHATLEEATQIIREAGLGEGLQLDWSRLKDLIELRDKYSGRLYRSAQKSLGGAPPYFVVEIKEAGRTYAVAETPVEGNATYIVAEHLTPGEWLEVLAMSKREARELGAARVIHGKNPHPRAHIEKIDNKLLDFMTLAD